MKKIKMGICFLDEEDNIISKKSLEATWSVDLEYQLKEKFDIKVEEEIASVLTEGFKLALTSDVIKEMLLEIKNEL